METRKDKWWVARSGIQRLKLTEELDLQVWHTTKPHRVNQKDPDANYAVRIFMHTEYIRRDSIEEAKLYATQRALEALREGLSKLNNP